MIDNLPVVSDWKGRSYVVGGLLGLGFGLLSAFLFVRATEDHGKNEPKRVSTMDAIRLGVALLTIVRQITDLAAND